MTLPENELNPLRILDFETEQMNPNVFDLDIDPLIQGLAGKIHLPGTTRTKPKNSKSKGVNKRELHEIDSAGLGMVIATSVLTKTFSNIKYSFCIPRKFNLHQILNYDYVIFVPNLPVKRSSSYAISVLYYII